MLNQRFPMERLTRLGWQLQQNHWTEQLELGTGQELEQRWLAEGSAYRQAMPSLNASMTRTLRRLLQRHHHSAITMTMQHTLLQGWFNAP